MKGAKECSVWSRRPASRKLCQKMLSKRCQSNSFRSRTNHTKFSGLKYELNTKTKLSKIPGLGRQRQAWSIGRAPGQAGLHRETLSWKLKINKVRTIIFHVQWFNWMALWGLDSLEYLDGLICFVDIDWDDQILCSYSSSIPCQSK